MELFQLEQFKAIAEIGNMTKAAESLYISQPALSKNLNNLEKEIGRSLFDRLNNKLVLNENGRLFLKQVNTVLEHANELKNMFKARNKNTIIIHSTSENFIDFFLSKYLLTHNSMTVDSRISYGESAKKILTRYNYDVIIAREENTDTEWIKNFCKINNIGRILIYIMRVYLVMPKDDNSIRKKTISIRELKNIPIVRMNKTSALETWLDFFEEDYGFHFNTLYRCDERTFKELMQRGRDKLITSSLFIDFAKNEMTEKKVIPITDKTGGMYVYYDMTNPNTREFVKIYTESFYKHLREHSSRNLI